MYFIAQHGKKEPPRAADGSLCAATLKTAPMPEKMQRETRRPPPWSDFAVAIPAACL
jgi:hypothetical protein